MRSPPRRVARLVAVATAGAALGAVPPAAQGQVDAWKGGDSASYRAGNLTVVRPVPAPLIPPPGYSRALEAGTRTASGAPGEAYWQQWSRYELRARLDPRTGVLRGEGVIRYRNRSPDTLSTLWLHVHQNYHGEGAPRNEEAEVTGGLSLRRLQVEGVLLSEGIPGDAAPDTAAGGYRVRGTLLEVAPPAPVAPGDTVRIAVEWSFDVPRAGAGARMGHSNREVYFLAYWFPRMAVYDDLRGWDAQPFRGRAEFYDGFGEYDVAVTVPNGWTVMGTGALENPEVVLTSRTRERLEAALAADGDTVVAVARAGDREAGAVTAESPTGWLTWRFRADSVRDFAWTASNVQNWDATRSIVPDRDGDGDPERVAIHSFWRGSAPHWAEQAAYARHSIEHHSRFTGLAYPWPHMTSVEGGGIIGGGMEFPMMTLMGDYNDRGADALYNVTAHELAHMWVPMIVSTNEKRWAWLDEGTTTFNENEARTDFFPESAPHRADRERYLADARAGSETELLRHGDLYPGDDYGTASYAKPATLLHTLRHLLGEETFLRGYRSFVRRWAFRHPTPFDLFRTMEEAGGRDLDWFWTSWYARTWTLDHGVAEVIRRGGETGIRVVDRGFAPMPARLEIELADGSIMHREIPVERWLEVPGGTRVREVWLEGSPEIVRVTVDARRGFPDVDRSNDTWRRSEGRGDSSGTGGNGG